jgi:hypothetical protein
MANDMFGGVYEAAGAAIGLWMKKLKLKLKPVAADIHEAMGFPSESTAACYIGGLRKGQLFGGTGKRANPEQALERLSVFLYYLGMTEKNPVIYDPGDDPFNPPANPRKISLIKYIKKLDSRFAYPPAKPPAKRIDSRQLQAAGLEQKVAS